MSVLSRLYPNTGTLYTTRFADPLRDVPDVIADYDILDAYYRNSRLYDARAEILKENSVVAEALKGLRTPAYRVVEFYASHLWPGTLPDALEIEPDTAITQPDKLTAAIQQFWAWSNWGSQKQVVSRNYAKLGDWFSKIATKQDARGNATRVYMQDIDPRHVVDFDVDERGYLVYVRIEVPRQRRQPDGTTQSYTHVEEWFKSQDSFRVWEIDRAQDAGSLGTPMIDLAMTTDFGIDFVPVVHAKFKDIGDDRGQSSFGHALDKIDEANRTSTKLHQMLFRYGKADMVVEGQGRDTQGRSLPPPPLNGTVDASSVTVGSDEYYALPSGWTLSHLIANVDYAAALNIVNAQMQELRDDLPELAYYQLRDLGNISGRAVQLLLSDARDRVVEARGNAEDALIRLDQMALTIAANAKLPEFVGLGSWDKGDFDHAFAERPVFEIPEGEQADNDYRRAQTAVLKMQYGYTAAQLQREDGLTQKEIDKMQAEFQASATQQADASLRQFNAG